MMQLEGMWIFPLVDRLWCTFWKFTRLGHIYDFCVVRASADTCKEYMVSCLASENHFLHHLVWFTTIQFILIPFGPLFLAEVWFPFFFFFFLMPLNQDLKEYFPRKKNSLIGIRLNRILLVLVEFSLLFCYRRKRSGETSSPPWI